MKTTSEDFINNETAIEHRPLEIYEVFNSSENYYWTSMDTSIVFDGNTYVPAAIKRSSIESDATINTNELTIDIPYNQEALGDLVSDMPTEDYSLKITRLFADDLTEGMVLFIGEIQSQTLKGPFMRAKVLSRHNALASRVPTMRHQIECNWELYSTYCGKNKNSYKTTTTATVVSGTNYTQLTSTDFDIADVQGIPYFRHGYIEYNGHTRTILDHYEETITIDYRIPGLTTTGSVDVYAGCDWRVETCNSKFSNLTNFSGEPELPRNNNPCTWV